ncbi:SDR family oxidoreductase [Novosphingobium flavum]|uniref:SDR family oxidoreductase n=1 Tax=Novosphingobium aerophilum TaxID=2839843 RepID=A0A7X1KBD0_9SPHN|nr:SDR family NAD(P)-dependent oxidoreductase [Novosphingobium aerophilum]MBC2651171.1 SDR family oxidoreductase [Novosphingobium aerophilum]MBC2660728.1 SDR family oxidoreductase [Novosphingobium aerophilum]
MDFADRHVVITGASTGIGKATATKIVSLGGAVTLIARRAELLADTCTELGGLAQWAAADVGDKEQLEAALDLAVTLNGPIDGLFLNAASGGTFAQVCDYPEESFEEVLTVNLRSPWWAIRRVLPAMLARGTGSILLTGSLGSERGMGGNAGYVVAKHGLRGLAMAVAAEVAGSGVRCNLVIPGFIETPMLANLPAEAHAAMADRTPQRRIGQPEELANVAAFLLSDEASYVTAQGWAVDGGVLGTVAL